MQIVKKKSFIDPYIWARGVIMDVCHSSLNMCRGTEAPSVKLTPGTWISSLLTGQLLAYFWLIIFCKFGHHKLQEISPSFMSLKHIQTTVSNEHTWVGLSGMPCKMRTFISWPHMKQGGVVFSPSLLSPLSPVTSSSSESIQVTRVMVFPNLPVIL